MHTCARTCTQVRHRQAALEAVAERTRRGEAAAEATAGVGSVEAAAAGAAMTLREVRACWFAEAPPPPSEVRWGHVHAEPSAGAVSILSFVTVSFHH